MRIGARRHRITVQEASEVRDTFGEVDVTWGTKEVLYASYKQAGAREVFQAGAVRGEVDAVFECRYFAGITPKDRISFDSRVFDILSVTNPDGRKRWMTIMCKERI